jgi:hypothetical protein
MTALQNNPLSTPLMSLNGIHNYIEMVKVYAIDAERMNDELIRYCLELNLAELNTLAKELELGYKVSRDQAARYCKIVDRCEALTYSAGLHEQKTQKTREVELL